MKQSPEGAVQVFDEFVRGFASPDLILDSQSAEAKKNASLLMDYVMTKYGWVTISYLQEADQVLSARLIRTPAPKAKTADELAAEEIAKQHRDYMDSIRPQESFDARVKAETAKKNAEKQAKAQQEAAGALKTTIDAYECYRVNGFGVDHTMTEAMRAELRTVKCGKDPIRTLAAVKAVIEQLPDHPQIGDVARTVANINARLRK